MKPILRVLFYILIIGVVVLVHTLFFVHHPPEIRDDLYTKPTMRMARGR
jgi:hypothetical protein